MENLLFAVAIAAYLAAAVVWPTLRLWQHHGIWPIVFDREAAPAQRVLGVLSAALFVGILALATLHVAVGPDTLGIWRLPAAARMAGWLLLLSGAALTLVAQQHMGAAWRIGIDDRPTDLITTGLFRYVRNPIFSGLLVLVAGIVVLSPAWWSVVIWILTALGLRLQVAWEEQHLVALHGDAYLAYAARAGRFVPFVGRLRAAPSIPSGRAPATTRR
jgi:protein-S-isoprenylcysteine O-methyltransferase Ste14